MEQTPVPSPNGLIFDGPTDRYPSVLRSAQECAIASVPNKIKAIAPEIEYAAMNGISSRQLVDEFLDCIESHDYDRARRLLANDGFRYESPISLFCSADDFIQHISLIGGILNRIRHLKVFADGDDLCHFLVFETQVSAKDSMKAVLWTRVSAGRIQQIELLFDSHWYRRMFEAET